MWWRKSPYKIAKTKVFGHNFNKTRQTLSDVILQEGDGVAVIPTLAKKITSELAEVTRCLSRGLISHYKGD